MAITNNSNASIMKIRLSAFQKRGGYIYTGQQKAVLFARTVISSLARTMCPHKGNRGPVFWPPKYYSRML